MPDDVRLALLMVRSHLNDFTLALLAIVILGPLLSEQIVVTVDGVSVAGDVGITVTVTVFAVDALQPVPYVAVMV